MSLIFSSERNSCRHWVINTLAFLLLSWSFTLLSLIDVQPGLWLIFLLMTLSRSFQLQKPTTKSRIFILIRSHFCYWSHANPHHLPVCLTDHTTVKYICYNKCFYNNKLSNGWTWKGSLMVINLKLSPESAAQLVFTAPCLAFQVTLLTYTFRSIYV